MPRAAKIPLARTIIGALSAVFTLTTAARTVAAQDTTSEPRWEFLVSSGRMVPTGAQRNAIKSGNATTAQLWYMLRPTVALTANAGWTRSRDIATAAEARRIYRIGTFYRNADETLAANGFAPNRWPVWQGVPQPAGEPVPA